MMPRRHRTFGLLLALALAVTGCAAEAPPEPSADRPSDVLDRITRGTENGDVHLVRLVQSGDRYRFDPDRIIVAPGDVVRFVMEGSQPESVVFDRVEGTPQAATFVRENQLHLGVLLTRAGEAYDVDFEGAPPGAYPFRSVPHAGHGMTGIVEVRD